MTGTVDSARAALGPVGVMLPVSFTSTPDVAVPRILVANGPKMLPPNGEYGAGIDQLSALVSDPSFLGGHVVAHHQLARALGDRGAPGR